MQFQRMVDNDNIGNEIQRTFCFPLFGRLSQLHTSLIQINITGIRNQILVKVSPVMSDNDDYLDSFKQASLNMTSSGSSISID